VAIASVVLEISMNKQDELKQQILEAVSNFQRTQLAVTCKSLTVDLHPDTLVVTLCGATTPAERDFARDRRARELLEKLYDELFDVIKPILEAKIQEILGRQVRRSRMNIDPESGAGVILITFAGEACVDEQ
jgi:uncharacterized protein YbcI